MRMCDLVRFPEAGFEGIITLYLHGKTLGHLGLDKRTDIFEC